MLKDVLGIAYQPVRCQQHNRPLLLHPTVPHGIVSDDAPLQTNAHLPWHQRSLTAGLLLLLHLQCRLCLLLTFLLLQAAWWLLHCWVLLRRPAHMGKTLLSGSHLRKTTECCAAAGPVCTSLPFSL